MESENDRGIAELSERVGTLRGITGGIHGEVESQHRLLDSMVSLLTRLCSPAGNMHAPRLAAAADWTCLLVDARLVCCGAIQLPSIVLAHICNINSLLHAGASAASAAAAVHEHGRRATESESHSGQDVASDGGATQAKNDLHGWQRCGVSLRRLRLACTLAAGRGSQPAIDICQLCCSSCFFCNCFVQLSVDNYHCQE